MDITNILAITEGLARQTATPANDLVINAIKAASGSSISVLTQPLTGNGTPGAVLITAADASQMGGAVGNGGAVTIQSGFAANPSQTGGNAGPINLIWSNGNGSTGVAGYLRTTSSTDLQWRLSEVGLLVSAGKTFGSIGATANFRLGGNGAEWVFDGANERIYLAQGNAILDSSDTGIGFGDNAIIGANPTVGYESLYPFNALYIGSGGITSGATKGNVYAPSTYQLDILSNGSNFGGTAYARFATPQNNFVTNLSGTISTSINPNQITGIADTSTLVVNMEIAGTGIPLNTTVKEIIDSNTILMSEDATADGTFVFTFAGIAPSSGLLVGIDASGNGLVKLQNGLNLSVLSKDSDSTTGGDVTVAAGSSSFAASNGGNSVFRGGDGTGTGTFGGTALLRGGNSSLSQGGAVTIRGGNGATNGGNVDIYPGLGGIGSLRLHDGIGNTIIDIPQDAIAFGGTNLVGNFFPATDAGFNLGATTFNTTGVVYPWAKIAAKRLLIGPAFSSSQPANNYYIDVRQGTPATAVYQQFAIDTTTGITSTDGLILGLDASGNAVFNLQTGLDMFLTSRTDNIANTSNAGSITLTGGNKTNAGANAHGGSINLLSGGSASARSGDIVLRTNATWTVGGPGSISLQMGTANGGITLSHPNTYSVDYLNLAINCATRMTTTFAGVTLFEYIRNAGRTFVAVGGDISDSTGIGNTYDIGRDVPNNTYPFRSLYLGTSALIGATTGSSFTPSARLQLRDPATSPVIFRITNSLTTDTQGFTTTLNANGSTTIQGAPNVAVNGTAGYALTISPGSKTASDADGGALNLSGGQGFGNSVGGAVVINGGDGPVSGAPGFGGAATLRGGNGTGTNANGGSVLIQGGSRTGTGLGGNITLRMGQGGSNPGFFLYDGNNVPIIVAQNVGIGTTLGGDWVSNLGTEQFGLAGTTFYRFGRFGARFFLASNTVYGGTETANNYHIDVRGNATAAYQQFTNTATGNASTNGLLVGIDATGNGILRLQSGLNLLMTGRDNSVVDTSLPGNIVITGGSKLAGDASGGDVTIRGGTGLSTGSGGSVLIQGANGPTSSTAGGVSIIGGNGTGAGGQGNGVYIAGGTGGPGGSGGPIQFKIGAGGNPTMTIRDANNAIVLFIQNVGIGTGMGGDWFAQTGNEKLGLSGTDFYRFDQVGSKYFLASNRAHGGSEPINNYFIDVRQRTPGTAVYQQFAIDTTTGIDAADGFLIGLDSSGNVELNQQEVLGFSIKTSGTTRLNINSLGVTTIGRSLALGTGANAPGGASTVLNVRGTGTTDRMARFDVLTNFAPNPSTGVIGLRLSDTQSTANRWGIYWETAVTDYAALQVRSTNITGASETGQFEFWPKIAGSFTQKMTVGQHVTLGAGTNLIVSGGQTYNTPPATIAPTGTTATVDWNNGNTQVLDVSAATGTVVVTFTNGAAGAVYTLFVLQGATARTVTFTALWSQTQGAPTNFVTNGKDVFSFGTYDGTVYFGTYGQNFT